MARFTADSLQKLTPLTSEHNNSLTKFGAESKIQNSSSKNVFCTRIVSLFSLKMLYFRVVGLNKTWPNFINFHWPKLNSLVYELNDIRPAQFHI